MPEAIIKVGEKRPPEPGKKRYKIVTPDGMIYQVNRDMEFFFKESKSYKIFFEDQEYNQHKFRVITKSPEEVPDISTGNARPVVDEPDLIRPRPRTAKEDEEGINRRHRLNWIGERLDALQKQGSTVATYSELRQVVGVLALLYDHLFAERNLEPTPDEFPARTLGASAQRAKANAYKPEQAASVDPDLDDDIPFN